MKHKIRYLLSVIISFVMIATISIPTEARAYQGNAQIHGVMQTGNAIQRIYTKGGCVYTYTHKITYHYDQTHTYTVNVEHGMNASKYGTDYAVTQGISITDYNPYDAPGKNYSLAGWKENDNSADGSINSKIISTKDVHLYAVWVKDCTSSFNVNGGSVTSWGSFETDGYARGYAYFNNGNSKPFRVKIPTVSRSGCELQYIINAADLNNRDAAAKYTCGAEYDVTEKTTFLCSWKQSFTCTKRSWFTYFTHEATANMDFTELSISVSPRDKKSSDSFLSILRIDDKIVGQSQDGSITVTGSWPAGAKISVRVPKDYVDVTGTLSN